MVYKKLISIKFYLGEENKILLDIFDKFNKKNVMKNAYGKDKNKRSLILRFLIEDYVVKNFENLVYEDQVRLINYVKSRRIDKIKLRTMPVDTSLILREKLAKLKEDEHKTKIKESVVTEPTKV